MYGGMSQSEIDAKRDRDSKVGGVVAILFIVLFFGSLMWFSANYSIEKREYYRNADGARVEVR